DHRDFSQLSRNLSNQTAERNQLLMRHQNLTPERDQLDVRLKTAELHLDHMSRNSGQHVFIYLFRVKVIQGRHRHGNGSEKPVIPGGASSVACPAGWRMFGGSCYFLSSSRSIWESSRRQCFTDGADLVTISSREEMVRLLKQREAAWSLNKFWIGLRQMSHISGWRWTDGSSPETIFWLLFICLCIGFAETLLLVSPPPAEINK
uniref:CD209 antigen-like protein E n=1 Tax=Fundulus heteroclitus TaxID=8078 RepID=A0A3Q2TIX1_FUNHE